MLSGFVRSTFHLILEVKNAYITAPLSRLGVPSCQLQLPPFDSLIPESFQDIFRLIPFNTARGGLTIPSQGLYSLPTKADPTRHRLPSPRPPCFRSPFYNRHLPAWTLPPNPPRTKSMASNPELADTVSVPTTGSLPENPAKHLMDGVSD